MEHGESEQVFQHSIKAGGKLQVMHRTFSNAST